jgi:hypothetical protein
VESLGIPFVCSCKTGCYGCHNRPASSCHFEHPYPTVINTKGVVQTKQSKWELFELFELTSPDSKVERILRTDDESGIELEGRRYMIVWSGKGGILKIGLTT